MISIHEAKRILEITDKNPNQKEIKTQYRKLAKLHHPDHGGDPKTFMLIQEAYDRLINSKDENIFNGMFTNNMESAIINDLFKIVHEAMQKEDEFYERIKKEK